MKTPQRVRNPIDSFVQARLERDDLSPAAEADRPTLIRRVTLDLTGIPPTPQDVAAFVSDPASNDIALEKVVDRLLASEQYGEHLARFWLDAARYADTSGYQYDTERTQWVWRDWVIDAFNRNMPFDQFTIEQTAGDLLPNATDHTRLATGFHRNHPITIEGGVIDEEYRTEYVIDRVSTTTTTWLGLTYACARCHDHKYDPISQEDFFSFFAFFNNIPERGLNGFDPKKVIQSPLAAGARANVDGKIEALRTALDSVVKAHPKWEAKLRENVANRWRTPVPKSVVSTGGATFRAAKDNSFLASGKTPLTDVYELVLPISKKPIAFFKLDALTDPTNTNGSSGRGENGNFVLTEFEVSVASPDAPEKWKRIKVAAASATYQQAGWPVSAAIDGVSTGAQGWAVDGNIRHENSSATFTLAEAIPPGSSVKVRLVHDFGRGHLIGKLRLSASDIPPPGDSLQEILAVEPSKRTPEQHTKIMLAMVSQFGDPVQKKQVSSFRQLMVDRAALDKATPATMVLSEMPQPRTTYILDRGEYDKPMKDKVLEPGVPSVLGSLTDGVPKNRLALAKWLVSREQPLTARVTVNRFWQQLFGVGLVKTVEDFGSQGEWPSHPKLLDWLAVDFMESGWDVKQLLKVMVTSGTYRQTSVIEKKSYADDPENRLLARGPRVRLDAEMIRDSALAISGSLDSVAGGPSVYPYHPKGLWLEINNRPGSSRAYPHPQDARNLYRRSMYSFWKRTLPPPSMAAFDAPGREYCVVNRSRTNTPLQAFVMLHDPQFVEAARLLARRMIKEGGETIEARIAFGFALATSRAAKPDETAALRAAFDARLTQYEADQAAAEKLLSVVVSPRDVSINLAEHAAYMQMARVLLNLSEFLTKG